MLLLASLIAALAAGDTLALPWPPTQTVRPGMVAVHPQPEVPLVALRLAVVANDPPGYAGAGHLIQHLVHPTLRERAARVGGQAQMERTSDALVYTVVGPARELEHLAGALRGALRPPSFSTGEVLRAKRDLAEERLAEWETAHTHVRAALRTSLFPDDLSAAGTDASAAFLQAESLGDVWARMYRPERVSIVAVGDVDMEVVEAAFSELPPDLPAAALPARQDTLRAVPLAPAEATRGWYGVGYPADELDPAVLSVAARLAGDALRRRLPGALVEAEHWWTHHGQALALVVAAPDSLLPDAQLAIGATVATLERDISEQEVRRAAHDVRRDLLFFVRTPDRMAQVLGAFSDRTANPRAAQEFFSSLEDVSADEVREALRRLVARTPARAQIPPQRRAVAR